MAAKSPRRNKPVVKPSCLPKLTNPGYTVSPSIEELGKRSEADLASVKGFSVRNEFGIISWEGEVDVRFLDIDKSIEIAQTDISVYTKDELEDGYKPEVGTKLNRPAVLTFFNVFPKKDDEETKAKFAKRIEKSTKKMGAELLKYDVDSGEWKIRVSHF